MEKLEAAKAADPAGFTERMQMLGQAYELVPYLSSAPGFDAQLQQEFVAASMPTQALAGLIEITNSGELKLEVTKNFLGQSSVKMTHTKPAPKVLVGGGLHSTSVKPMDVSVPQCGASVGGFLGLVLHFHPHV